MRAITSTNYSAEGTSLFEPLFPFDFHDLSTEECPCTDSR